MFQVVPSVFTAHMKAHTHEVRGTKKFALLAAPWLAASAWAVRFFAAFTAVAAALSVLPAGRPLRMLNRR